MIENGGQGRNRTADASLFRAALYHLSYLANLDCNYRLGASNCDAHGIITIRAVMRAGQSRKSRKGRQCFGQAVHSLALRFSFHVADGPIRLRLVIALVVLIASLITDLGPVTVKPTAGTQ